MHNVRSDIGIDNHYELILIQAKVWVRVTRKHAYGFFSVGNLTEVVLLVSFSVHSSYRISLILIPFGKLLFN